MIEFKPPHYPVIDLSTPSVFLAGSIEMGKAVDWQSYVTSALDPYQVQVFNPRRDDWDSSWTQSIDNKQFVDQVNWEQMYLTISKYVLFNFCKDTYSPISLLELGQRISIDQESIILCCDPQFWRRGNIDVIARNYRVEVLDNLDEAIDLLITRLEKINDED